MEKEIVGPGFYVSDHKDLTKLVRKRQQELDKIQQEIKAAEDELLSATSNEEAIVALNKKSDAKRRYDDLKKKDLFVFDGESGIHFQDEDKHIIESIKRVISTRRGERIGNLSFGSDVSKYIFMPEMSIDDVINEIVNSLKRCEPRIEVLECTLTSFEHDTAEINLVFRVKKTSKILSTNFKI